MSDELQRRREIQYQLLDQSTKAEDARGRAADDNEALAERLEVTATRAGTLERSLREAEDDLREERAERAQERAAAAAVRSSLEERLERALGEERLLKKEVEQATRNVTEALRSKAEAEALRTADAEAARRKEEALEARSEKDRAQAARLQEEALTQGRARMAALTEQEALKRQVQTLVQDVQAARATATQARTRLERRRAEFAEKEREQGEKRRRLLGNYVLGACLGAATQWALPVVDLSGCGLDDDAASLVVRVLRTELPPMIMRLDLQRNRLTDRSARRLAALLQRGPTPRLLDLRGNAITAGGVRSLAEALQRNDELGEHNVFVHTDGLVEAVLEGDARAAAEAALGDDDAARRIGRQPHIVVDCRDCGSAARSPREEPGPAAAAGRARRTGKARTDEAQTGRRKDAGGPGREGRGARRARAKRAEATQRKLARAYLAPPRGPQPRPLPDEKTGPATLPRGSGAAAARTGGADASRGGRGLPEVPRRAAEGKGRP
jgi:chemotaxis protein histidine kinase CheA